LRWDIVFLRGFRLELLIIYLRTLGMKRRNSQVGRIAPISSLFSLDSVLCSFKLGNMNDRPLELGIEKKKRSYIFIGEMMLLVGVSGLFFSWVFGLFG